MRTVKTLPVRVYRSKEIGDCTNGGISAAHDTLYLVHDRYETQELYDQLSR